ncbi:MAG: DUF4957 domain-containing protein [Bacteroidales bacterium]|jgi:hypothetical protein|nr:DUF4957 domain-containing protein [Bacteroidales bacterium]MCI2122315.1 DUF4957 domain-containing protein [Bacteroidales bacterium]MCI2145294.1 DUF4957 domain-containing protein [Bacteroidales bacterium]
MKKIFKTLALIAAAFSLASCVEPVEDIITDLNLKRCLEPMNLTAKIASDGETVTYSWDVPTGTDKFVLEVYTDEEMTDLAETFDMEASEVPFKADMESDMTYYYRVKGQSNSGKEDSKWASYGKAIKTYAVKDKLPLEITGRTTTSITVSWQQDDEVTHLLVEPDGADSYEVDLTADQIAAGAATVEGLTASTRYDFTLYYKSANRGQIEAWTRPVTDGVTTVASSAAILQAFADKAPKILVAASDTAYPIGSADLSSGIEIYGEEAVDGTKPILLGDIHVTKDFTGSFYAESVTFDGDGQTYGFPIQAKNGGGASSITFGEIHYKNCDITGYSKGLIYEWSQPMIIGSLIYEGCYITDMNTGLAGGDGIDLRNSATVVDNLTLKNNTIWNGFRSFIRLDASVTVGNVILQNNTIVGLCNLDESTNNGGLMNIKCNPTSVTVVQNLIMNETGTRAAMIGEVAANITAESFSFSKNYFYDIASTFWTTKCTEDQAIANGGKLLSESPCYNIESGIFNLTNSEALAAEVGDPRWFIPYFEKEEDLTLSVVEAPKVWDFSDTKVFNGTAEKSTVKDNLLFRVSNKPISISDATVWFSGAATLDANTNIPDDCDLEFLVDKPGALYLKTEGVDGYDSHVSVSVNGVVKGGAAYSDGMNNVQKILISDITEQSTVYVYGSGPIGISELEWSDDSTQVSTALPAPDPSADPSLVTEGDASDVLVTWPAVDYAGSYSVVFSGKTYTVTDPEYTISAQTVQFLSSGAYPVEVYANPAADDVYYTQSSKGVVSLVVLPAGGSGSSAVTVTTVDDLMSAVAAGKSDIILAASGSPYTLEDTWVITQPLKLSGEDGDTKPVVIGSIKLSGAEVGDVTLENLAFNGNDLSLGSLLEVADGSLLAGAVKVIDCDIYGYNKSMIYSSQEGSKISSVTFDGDYIHDTGLGQNGFDIRKGEIDTLTITNSTVAYALREGFRIDAAAICNVVSFKNNTVNNMAPEYTKTGAMFYIRSEVGTIDVENNLFMNQQDNLCFFRGKPEDLTPALKNNWFYNNGANWFAILDETNAYNNVAEDEAIANGGGVLSADPVSDATNSDFTLTNPVLQACNVGDPRWNPNAGGSSSDSFTVSNLSDMLAAISAGKSDITLEAGDYDFTTSEDASISSGIMSVTKDLTLRGESGARIIGGFKVSGSEIKSLRLSGLTLDGSSKTIGIVVEEGGTDVDMNSIVVEDCEITGYAKSLFYASSSNGGKIALLSFNGLLMHEVGGSQDEIDIRSGEVDAVVFRNSTACNSAREFFRIDASVVCNTLSVRNNTFYRIGEVSGKTPAFFYVRTVPATWECSSNIYLNMADNVYFTRSKDETASIALSNNWFYACGANWFKIADDTKAYNNVAEDEAISNGGGVLTENPCPGSETGDFTVSGTLAGTGTGDPRWN